jgi:hypothetical protein
MVATAGPAHAQVKMSLLAIVHSQTRRFIENMSTTVAAELHTVQPLHRAPVQPLHTGYEGGLGWAALQPHIEPAESDIVCCCSGLARENLLFWFLGAIDLPELLLLPLLLCDSSTARCSQQG